MNLRAFWKVGASRAGVAPAAPPVVGVVLELLALGAGAGLVGPLDTLDVGDGAVDLLLVGGVLGGGEGGDGDRGVVVGQEVLVNAAVVELVGEELVVAPLDEVGVRAVLGVLREGFER